MPIDNDLRKKLIATAIAIIGIVSAAFVQHQGIANAVVAMQSNLTQGRVLNRKRRREEENELPLMKNLFQFRCRPQQPLGPCRDAFGKYNTMKTLAVINKHGYFIYYDLLAKDRRNDRDQWTSWFPIFGAQQRYWHYDMELLELSIEAAMRLHNWMLRKRGLSYDAQASNRNHLRYHY